MATKKKSKTPAVRYLRYELTNDATPGQETSHFIDLARDLSAINRRLYRQGRRYHVKRVTVVSRNTTAAPGGNAGFVSFCTVPESWMTEQAWKRGFKVWQMMQKRAIESAGSDLRGTYNDFKVYMSQEHAGAPAAQRLQAVDSAGNVLSGGDWSYSDFITPDGTTTTDEFYATMLGDHNPAGIGAPKTSISLVRSYAESRMTVSANPSPESNNVQSDDPLMNLFDDGSQVDEIIDKMLTDGEDPPYDQNDYPGADSNMPKPLVVQHTTLGTDGKATVGGFSVMCGLLEIEATSPVSEDVYSVLVELAPGNYRGIAAEVI